MSQHCENLIIAQPNREPKFICKKGEHVIDTTHGPYAPLTCPLVEMGVATLQCRRKGNIIAKSAAILVPQKQHTVG